MSMKKTDLEKNMAKKLGRQLKASAIPQRFGAGSAQAATKKDKTVATASKTVLISIRLPAELASRTRERAMDQEGGINAVVTQALELWLAGSNPGSEDSTQGST